MIFRQALDNESELLGCGDVEDALMGLDTRAKHGRYLDNGLQLTSDIHCQMMAPFRLQRRQRGLVGGLADVVDVEFPRSALVVVTIRSFEIELKIAKNLQCSTSGTSLSARSERIALEHRLGFQRFFRA